jgi:hypothetical protein
MYISSKWVGEEVKEFRTVSRKASAFLEVRSPFLCWLHLWKAHPIGRILPHKFDFISDHIDQCMKKSLKETQSEISTISHKCKTLKRKCRKQQTALDEALEARVFPSLISQEHRTHTIRTTQKLQHKESELAELQQREGGQSTQSLISWEWDDGSGAL